MIEKNHYNHYNHYRDRDSDLDLDLDWGVVIYNQIVTWTAFAILAMFSFHSNFILGKCTKQNKVISLFISRCVCGIHWQRLTWQALIKTNKAFSCFSMSMANTPLSTKRSPIHFFCILRRFFLLWTEYLSVYGCCSMILIWPILPENVSFFIIGIFNGECISFISQSSY